MVHKTTVFKRKFSAFLPLFLIGILLSGGVFGICMGLWFFFSSHPALVSPLGKTSVARDTVRTKIQNHCGQNHLNCTAIMLNTDNTATITIDTDETVIFSLQKDLTAQFSSLQLTISHLTIEGKRFRRLDFRFDNPVISY